MRIALRQQLRVITVCLCVVCLLGVLLEANAADISSLENRSSDLSNTLDSINGELLEIGTKIADNEMEIEAVNGDIAKTEEQLAIARKNEETYYDEMKIRIQYIYENSGEPILGLILSAESMADFVNKVHFVQTMSEYDRNMFEELQELRRAIEAEEEHLKDQQEACLRLEEELSVNREELKAKAASTSADLVALEAKIKQLKDEQLAKELAAAAKAAREAQKAEAERAGQSVQVSQNSTNNTTTNNGSVSGGNTTYTPPSGSGILTKDKGVNYFNGHRETYYSQRVLPGHGLNIPGRHVASDGTIRDGNGYLCVASSDYPKGTVVQTSLGTAIVYDTGCASGTIDIYTDW
ncbi:MAG: hypothetical protein HFG88_07200 [Dorea sp.]|nr:hypothetical protein [Dorea sp.]